MKNNWIIIKGENDYPIVKDSHYWVEKPSGEITVNFFKDSFYSPHFTKVNVAYMLIDEPSPRIKKEDKVENKKMFYDDFEVGDTIAYNEIWGGITTGRVVKKILTEEFLSDIKKWDTEKNYHNMIIIKKKDEKD